MRRAIRCALLALIALLPATRAGAGTPAGGVWEGIGPPSARYGHSAIYDPVRDRMVVFGGYDNSRSNDTWVMTLSGTPEWRRLTPSGTLPDRRFGHSAVYDPVRDRMLVFGVDDDDFPDHVWALSFATEHGEWSQLPASPLVPKGLYEHASIYDPVRDRVLIFGGTNLTLHGEVWSLSLSGTPAWEQLPVVGPTPRSSHTAIYDPVRDRMIVFGGADSNSAKADVWALSLAGDPSWTEITPADTVSPPPLVEHTAIYDPTGDRMIVFGGVNGAAPGPLEQRTWALSLSGTPAWSLVQPANPPPEGRYRHAAIYDPARQRMLVFGGSDPSRKNDVWELSLTGVPAWTRFLRQGSPPPDRQGAAMVYDPYFDRMVVFGGFENNSDNVQDDTRVLSFSGLRPLWSTYTVNTPPPGRSFASTIYDPRRQRLMMFGGLANGILSDTWELSLDRFVSEGAWNPIPAPFLGPAAPGEHFAVYDPKRDRMILYGNYELPGFIRFAGVWALTLSGTPEWTTLVSGRPRLIGPSGIVDPVRDRLIAIGLNSQTSALEAWEMSLTTLEWSQIIASSQPTHYVTGAVYDPVRHRILVHGGVDHAAWAGETWALSLGDSPAWTQLAPGGATPPDGFGWMSAYDGNRDAFLFTGAFGNGKSSDTWRLAFGTHANTEVVCPDSIGLGKDSTLTARYVLSHSLGEPRAIEWTLYSEWPGYPRHGFVVVGATPETISVRIDAPDSASGEEFLTMNSAFVGASTNLQSCSHRVGNIVTPALASLVSVEADEGRVHLVWHVEEIGSWWIERREEGGAWIALAERMPDGSGRIIYEDRSVAAGARYGYRLRGTGANAGLTVGDAWVVVPDAASFAIAGVRPTPATGPMQLAFTIPTAGRVRIESFDVTGRRAGVRDVDLAAGFQVLPVPFARAQSPGIYALRVTWRGQSLETRAVVTR